MQLHAAAARGDMEGMTLALRQGADIHARNSSGQSALIFALERAGGFSYRHGPTITPDAVQLLIKVGIDIEASDSLGATAIHHAAKIPNLGILEQVLEHGGDAKHVTKSGYSVLTHACYQPSGPQKRAIVRRLHHAGASLDTKSDYGEFPLGVCLYFGDLETLGVLLELGADPKPLNWTPLHHVVAFGNKSDLDSLSSGGAEINAANPGYQLSPWQLSFIRGDLGMIGQLAVRGADLTQVGRGSQSLMHVAARFGHVATLRWLHELGADSNALDDLAVAPLHEAVEWNHLESACTLMDLGADAKGEAIHAAKSLEMVQALVERGGAEVNAVNGCGEWPLKLAAETNDFKRIEWLLNHGAQVDRTSTGETALHTAVRNDSLEAVEMLLAAGANPNQPDVDGWTPLFGALSREAIQLLRKAGANPHLTDQATMGPEEWIKDPLLIQALGDLR